MTTESLNSIWKSISRSAVEAARMETEEARAFRDNKVAQLVGTLPFLAGCQDPDRSALSHLATWIQANRGFARSVYDHRPSDDTELLRRLQPLGDFSAGDRAIIDRGMAILGLAMLGSYQRDIEVDMALGNYNPLGAQAWDYGTIEAELLSRCASPHPQMDSILSAEEALRTWWEF